MNHETIILLTQMLANHRSRSPSTVGRWASGDGALYARLSNGRSLTTHRAAKITQWFSDHWPEDLEWPEDIPRPSPLREEGKDAA